MSKTDGLRFGVGSASGAQSSVWSLWVNRGQSDVYLGARVVAGVMKLSFHESGRWRLAFTKEWAEGHDVSGTPTGERLWEEWGRPPANDLGLTLAFYIMVPRTETVSPFGSCTSPSSR